MSFSKYLQPHYSSSPKLQILVTRQFVVILADHREDLNEDLAAGLKL